MSKDSLLPITKCEGCVFATLDKDVQIGCDLKRHEKLGFSTLDNEKTFTLGRFCNTYRPDAWLAELNFEQRMDNKTAVMEEVHSRLGFVIRFDLESEDPIGDLSKTLTSIQSVAKYVVVINEKVEYNEDIWGTFIKHFGEDPKTKYHIVQLNTIHRNLETIIDQCFTHAENGWIQCLTSGDQPSENNAENINDFINVKMKKLVMILPKDPANPFTGLTFPAYLFKFLNGNRVKVFRDEMVDSRSFVEKVLAAEKRNETKTVYTWEEFNAS